MSAVRKRSVTINGHRTSFSLEDAFFAELQRIAAASGMSLTQILTEIDDDRPADCNLSSAVRLHILGVLKKAAGNG